MGARSAMPPQGYGDAFGGVIDSQGSSFTIGGHENAALSIEVSPNRVSGLVCRGRAYMYVMIDRSRRGVGRRHHGDSDACHDLRHTRQAGMAQVPPESLRRALLERGLEPGYRTALTAREASQLTLDLRAGESS